MAALEGLLALSKMAAMQEFAHEHAPSVHGGPVRTYKAMRARVGAHPYRPAKMRWPKEATPKQAATAATATLPPAALSPPPAATPPPPAPPPPTLEAAPQLSAGQASFDRSAMATLMADFLQESNEFNARVAAESAAIQAEIEHLTRLAHAIVERAGLDPVHSAAWTEDGEDGCETLCWATEGEESDAEQDEEAEAEAARAAPSATPRGARRARGDAAAGKRAAHRALSEDETQGSDSDASA